MAMNKHNLDSVAMLGGVETCITAMKNHPNDQKIYDESCRCFIALSQNPEYAAKIG